MLHFWFLSWKWLHFCTENSDLVLLDWCWMDLIPQVAAHSFLINFSGSWNCLELWSQIRKACWELFWGRKGIVISLKYLLFLTQWDESGLDRELKGEWKEEERLLDFELKKEAYPPCSHLRAKSSKKGQTSASKNKLNLLVLIFFFLKQKNMLQ